MRLVQRHGRVDRIGSRHDYVYLWCLFPDIGLNRLLNLEGILHRKLMKAAKSIGTGRVLPGIDTGDDVVFNARREQIESLAGGDNTLLLGTAAGLISGEEFRAVLRKAIENESLARKLEAMPWGIGSGFAASDRPPGYVFCAQILDRADEPAFRYVPLPTALIPQPGAPALAASSGSATVDRIPLHVADHPAIEGNPVDIVTDTLTALSAASPPESRAEPVLPDQWTELAYKAWAVAQADIARVWNESLDTTAAAGAVPAPIREEVRHLTLHGAHRTLADVDQAIKTYSRGQATRVTAMVRSVMRDEGLTDRTKTDRLIELIDELDLSAAEARPKRFPVQPPDIHLIAWMAISPGTS
jgi:hypothetical protein